MISINVRVRYPNPVSDYFTTLIISRFHLPLALMVQWNQDVQKKSDDDIYAAEINGAVHFGKSIPKPHKLCTVMEKEFQDWLRLMLLWDKTRRGGRTHLTKVCLFCMRRGTRMETAR